MSSLNLFLLINLSNGCSFKCLIRSCDSQNYLFEIYEGARIRYFIVTINASSSSLKEAQRRRLYRSEGASLNMDDCYVKASHFPHE